jgi:recombination protein RecR
MQTHNQYPEILEEVIAAFKGLPGIGRRTAERIALTMVKWQPGKLEHLGKLLQNLHETVTLCPECGNLASHGKICAICASPARDQSIICVVEDFSQIFSIENSAFYKGVYHVLGGKLSPLENRHAAMLTTDSLQRRIDALQVQEVILALSQDVEGQATAVYISSLLKGKNIKITRLARGLPAGSDISYADSATIGAALHGRILMN